MKIFISQPMKDKTNEEIEKERGYILDAVIDKYPNEDTFELIDSFFKDAPHDSKPLWFLAKSLELMCEADLIVFAKDWAKYRGCRIEHESAIGYGYKVMYM